MTNSVSKTKKLAKALALRRKTTTIYVPVYYNVYYDGLSYRVRVTKENHRTSKNFKCLKEALKFRKKLVCV